jgi:hypothetical protein
MELLDLILTNFSAGSGFCPYSDLNSVRSRQLQAGPDTQLTILNFGFATLRYSKVGELFHGMKAIVRSVHVFVAHFINLEDLGYKGSVLSQQLGT